jgi:hypothetical protein
MKFLLLTVLLFQVASTQEPPVAQPSAMRYERAIHLPALTDSNISGQACAVIDGLTYSHAAPSLADLRIFPAGATDGAHEIPYATTMSDAASQDIQSSRLLNIGTKEGKIDFDLEMPARPYTDVVLDIDPGLHDFLANVAVTGSDALGDGQRRTSLGEFTLFDLTSQHLSRNTTLSLQESTFRYLHVTMQVANAPGAVGSAARFAAGMVEGASVPPSREEQVLYTAVAESNSIVTVGRETRARFMLPVRIPVERVAFTLDPAFKGNFSRDVRITAQAQQNPDVSADARSPLAETMSGTIIRIHTTEAAREISHDQLDVPAILGANLQSPAKVEVAVENGDDQPLPITAVRLEMRQRELCFDASNAAAAPLALYYGNTHLAVPVYDYDRLFIAAEKPLVAELGPETLNAKYSAPTAEPKTFTEHHPETLWVALIAVVCALGVVALRSARNVGH